MPTQKGLPLNFDYRMMSLIRELASKERYRVWTEEKLPNFMKNTPNEQIKRGYKLMIEDERNPWTRAGLCNLILDEIQNMEDQLKNALDPMHFDCPECNKIVTVVDMEPNYHKLPLYIPRWRELSCGHIVGITGDVIKNAKIHKEKKLIVEKTLVIE